jgi:hypothetical protein
MKKANETKPFAVLRRQDYPMLVTFTDVNQPSSVAEVCLPTIWQPVLERVIRSSA